MNSDFIVLVTWLRGSEMDLFKSAVRLDRDTQLGQNYKYWNEDEVKSLWREKFDLDEEVHILAIEEIEDIR